ncbi:MAG: hypothetical protein PUB29_12425 [Bacteroidales bacterium]|nr:hypothetical protein [Bacteroidales bacterium]
MKRNALKTLTLLCVVLCCGLGSLNAQEQQEKKIAYNFINEYGFFVGKNVGWTGVFINGISIKQNDNIGIGVGYGLNSGTFQEIPLFLNYRHYFDRGRKLKPLINVAAGAALHFWTDDHTAPVYDEYGGIVYYNYIEENKHGIGLYATIAGGFRVKALSFTGGFFFRTFPNEKGFSGGIEAKVGYTF